MQHYKTFQNIIFGLSFFLILKTTTGCHQKTTNEGLKRSSNVEMKKTTKTISEKINSTKKPSVIYKSNDLGRSWSSFAKGIPEEATLSGIKQEGNNIYITTDYHGVFVISKNQDTWTSLKIKNFKDLDINCIEVEAKKLVLGTLNQGIIVSNDGGLSWKSSEKNIPNSSIRAFIKSKNKLYAGTDSGIFESADMGNTWTHVFGQMQILGFTSLNDKIYAATQNGAMICEGNAKNWEYIYEGDALHDISNDGTYIYAMTIGQQLLKTQNDGEVWENAQNGINYPVNFYTNEIQHIEKNIFSAQWIGIYHSSDNGKNWSILNGLPDSTAFSTLEITNLGIIAGISIR
ncbi:MAG: WD40/YVTN/BNR-like repeat-containing protein [Saprospiraceae bacterium]